MNCDIERTLQRIQAERCEEHLPMESILWALHDAEYGEHLFLRDHSDGDATSSNVCRRYRRPPPPR